jgi:hypothetical protein
MVPQYHDFLFLYGIHGLNPLASSHSELSSETMNLFKWSYMVITWTGHRLSARPLIKKCGHTSMHRFGLETLDPSVRGIQDREAL